jgi:hypothetical protein
MHQKTFLLVAIATALVAPTADAANPHQYIARAYAISTDELLYTEHHREVWVDGELVGGRVEYRDAVGETFARKRLSFGRDLFAPSFEMIDERNGFQEGAEWGEDGLRLFASRGNEERSKVIESPPSTAVIDAGFHRFMQALLPELRRGRDAEFDFAVPSYGRFFRFRVSAVEGSAGGEVRLRMKPANALLRLLVDPIELVYGLDGRLLEFEGMTNIPDDRGERHLARIIFEYPDAADSSTRVAAAG